MDTQQQSESSPSSNGKNGRDTNGRFTKGNLGGPGNPLAGRIVGLRKALLSALGEKDVQEIVSAMVKTAKKGDVAAAKFLFSYTVGVPISFAELEVWSKKNEQSPLRDALNSMSVSELVALARTSKENDSCEAEN